MKLKRTIYLIAVFTLGSLFIFQYGCKKDEEQQSDPTPPVYTNGEGEIGNIGGTIKVTDPSSALNGIELYIPVGALANNQVISIQKANDTLFYPADSSALVVQLEPEGLEFSKPVELSIPFNSNENKKKIKGFYLDLENGVISQIPTVIDSNAMIARLSTIHFSSFCITDEGVTMNTEMFYINNKPKVAMSVNAWNGIDYGFDGIPVKPIIYLQGMLNAMEVVDEWEGLTDPNVFSVFNIKLKKKVDFWFDPTIEEKTIFIKRIGQSGFYGAEVYNNSINTQGLMLSHEELNNTLREVYFSGEATIANFNTQLESNEEYYIVAKWALSHWGIDPLIVKYTDVYEFNSFDYAMSPGEMSSTNPDVNNNCVVDNLESTNQQPVASFTISPTGGNLTTVFTFDASGCSDEQDPTSALQVRWDFEGDGIWDTQYSTDKITSNQFQEPGSYNVKLEVKDTDENMDETSNICAVYLNNTPPFDIFLEDVIAPNSELTMTFVASDIEGPWDIMEFRFDFENDGNWDTDFLLADEWIAQPGFGIAKKTITHDFGQTGLFWIKIGVKDAQEIYNEGLDNVNVQPWNPTGTFTVDPTSGNTSTIFEFDASGCTDYQDPVQLLQVRWDWEDDGTWDTGFSNDKTISHQFLNPDTYTIRMEVKDTDENTNSTTKIIEVTQGNNVPVADFIGEPTAGPVPLTVNFTDLSTNNPTSWEWDFGDGGTSTEQNPLHIFETNDTYTVSLTVANDFGSDNETKTNYIYVGNTGAGEPCPGTPTITDVDGNVYNTVLIGDQCWMKENLKTTTYNNGVSIPNVTVNSAWSSLTNGAYVWYDNDISWKDKYGALYNWYTTVDANGLCPNGWHVPTHDEWMVLTDYIGGTGDPHGNELKSCRQINSPLGGGCNTSEHPRWQQHNIHYGTDDYGFSGLPGGYRFNTGYFNSMTTYGIWWSTESSSTNAENINLKFDLGTVYWNNNNKKNGYHVRCLKD
ncbi:MAG: PKD domain-containing protein [Bacteroidetes bacterium]|nr:PKD domain-containing protein [Bacteroidota bacterium]